MPAERSDTPVYHCDDCRSTWAVKPTGRHARLLCASCAVDELIFEANAQIGAIATVVVIVMLVAFALVIVSS